MAGRAWISGSIKQRWKHIGIYQNRLDVNAVIHTHQPFASVLAVIGKPIPALLDEITVEIGHVVDIVSYAYSGTSELVNNVIGKLDNACHCYLMQNHGALSLGNDIQHAMKNAELLEHVATIYYRALATGEEIQKLPSTAIDYFAGMRKPRFKKKENKLAKIKTLLLQRPKTRYFFEIFYGYSFCET